MNHRTINTVSVATLLGATCFGLFVPSSTFADGPLQTSEVHQILWPILLSTDLKGNRAEAQKVYVKIPSAAKQAIEDLERLSYAKPDQAADLRALGKQIALPFHACLGLQKRPKLEAELERMKERLDYVKKNPPRTIEGIDHSRHELIMSNAQRNVNTAAADLAELDKIAAKAAEQFAPLNNALAFHVGEENWDAVYALAACMHVLKQHYQLDFPFDPAVSRDWLALSLMDESTRERYRANALENVVKWAAMNVGGRAISYVGMEQLRGTPLSDDPLAAGLAALFLIYMGEGMKSTSTQMIEQELETLLFQPNTVAPKARRALELLLPALDPLDSVTNAMVRQALNQTAPELADNEFVVGVLTKVAQEAIRQAQK